MSTQSRVYYLILEDLKLSSNIIEAASQPDWMRIFRASVLSSIARTLESKQLRDGVAAVSHLLRSVSGGDCSPSVNTGQEPVPGEKRHVWQIAEIH